MSGGYTVLGDQEVTSRKINLTWATADVVTEESTTSTSFTDLSTTGPSITLSPGITQDQELDTSIMIRNAAGTNECHASPSINGVAASAEDSAMGVAVSVTPCYGIRSRRVIASAMPDGAIHVLKYKVSSSTGLFSHRRLNGKAL